MFFWTQSYVFLESIWFVFVVLNCIFNLPCSGFFLSRTSKRNSCVSLVRSLKHKSNKKSIKTCTNSITITQTELITILWVYTNPITITQTELITILWSVYKSYNYHTNRTYNNHLKCIQSYNNHTNRTYNNPLKCIQIL